MFFYIDPWTSWGPACSQTRVFVYSRDFFFQVHRISLLCLTMLQWLVIWINCIIHTSTHGLPDIKCLPSHRSSHLYSCGQYLRTGGLSIYWVQWATTGNRDILHRSMVFMNFELSYFIYFIEALSFHISLISLKLWRPVLLALLF